MITKTQICHTEISQNLFLILRNERDEINFRNKDSYWKLDRRGSGEGVLNQFVKQISTAAEGFLSLLAGQ